MIPENQLKLSEQELKEEFSRVLTANDPNVPNNITKYNYKERCFKMDPPGSGDHLFVHLCEDGSMLHRESEDAKTQAAFEQKMAEEAKEARELAIRQAKEEAEAKGEKIDEAAFQFESGKNQFNYRERAAQTYTNPLRQRSSSRELPRERDAVGDLRHVHGGVRTAPVGAISAAKGGAEEGQGQEG